MFKSTARLATLPEPSLSHSTSLEAAESDERSSHAAVNSRSTSFPCHSGSITNDADALFGRHRSASSQVWTVGPAIAVRGLKKTTKGGSSATVEDTNKKARRLRLRARQRQQRAESALEAHEIDAEVALRMAVVGLQRDNAVELRGRRAADGARAHRGAVLARCRALAADREEAMQLLRASLAAKDAAGASLLLPLAPFSLPPVKLRQNGAAPPGLGRSCCDWVRPHHRLPPLQRGSPSAAAGMPLPLGPPKKKKEWCCASSRCEDSLMKQQQQEAPHHGKQQGGFGGLCPVYRQVLHTLPFPRNPTNFVGLPSPAVQRESPLP